MDQTAAEQQSQTSVSADHGERAERRGLWAWVQEQINLALYRPQPADGVVDSRLTGREGVYYVLRSPDARTYLKLTERDYFVWTQMGNQRSVKDLVVAYFVEFGAFAFDRVGQLVRELRRGGFLVDRPLDVMAHVDAELKTRAFVSKGERLTSAFINHEITVSGIDGFLDRLYRYTFWLFSWPVQLLLLLVILSGMGAFIVTFVEGQIPLLTVGGSYVLGLLVLLVINVFIILIHELAHGLTTKHFGRKVRRGGFLIYYGYPAFFVDTMDMWLSGRWARIAVTWAGPHSGLIIGGLCYLAARAFPGSILTLLLFKLAFVAYVNVFFNLNPLLELDGYFILVDLVDVPMLRQRSFQFVRHQLLSELREAWRKWHQGQANWRQGFTSEERLLAVFGLLAAAYTVYSVWIALVFWQTQIVTALRDLWERPGWASKLLLVLALLGIVIPIGLALLAQLLSWGRRGLAWLREKGFFERDRYVTLVLFALTALLALGPTTIFDPWWSRYLVFMPLALLSVAVAALSHTALWYRGSEFQRVFWALDVAVGLLWSAALLRLVVYAMGDSALKAGTEGVDNALAPVIYSLERLSMFPVALAGILGLSGVGLRQGSLWERGATAVLIILAGLASMSVIQWTSGDPFYQALLSVSASYLTLIFLVAALPNLIAFSHTRFFIPWLALTAAAVLTGATSFLRALPSPPAFASDLDRWLALVMASIWALGAVLYDIAGWRVHLKRPSWADIQVISEEERLRQAFSRFFAGLFDAFKETFGSRRAQGIDNELGKMAVAANWRVEISGGRVDDEFDLSHITLGQQAERYREVLASTVALIDDWAGRPFVARAAQNAYDVLPWFEREVLGRYVLSGTDWGAAIAAQFSTFRDVRWRLVRALPLFAHCDDRALNLIVSTLEHQHVTPGTVLARQGAPVDRFILIQSGEVEAWRRDGNSELSQLNGELRRGATVGDQAFLGIGTYEATYRVSASSELLILDHATCDRLLRAGVAIATRVGASLEVVRLLSDMPLFSHLSAQQLSNVANGVHRRSVWGTQVVAHMGAERHSLFIVLEGEVEALTEDEAGNKVLAYVYTPGEHFGEYALFANTPYQFTYRTRGPAILLTLEEEAFDALVAQSGRMANYVEQVGSGRLLMKPRSSSGALST